MLNPERLATGICTTLDSAHDADPTEGHRRELRWLRGSLDCIDYPVLCVTADHKVLLANRAARLELAEETHPLRLVGDSLKLRQRYDLGPLQRAMDDALRLGLQRLVMVGDGPKQVAVAVRPLSRDATDSASAPEGVLVMLGKRWPCNVLSADWFARARGLTGAETRVLHKLSAGLRSRDIALGQGVALSTVRTHVRSLCAKTGAASVRDLLQQVATLPPMPGALDRAGSSP